MRLIDADALSDAIERTDWYHISLQGNLARGARSDIHTPLYKADDIYEALCNAPTIDVVPAVLDDEMKTIDNAIRCYGIRSQAVVAIEELSELQKELCKWLRGNADFNHIAEEIADVEIMVTQIKRAFGLNEQVNKQRIYKLRRLEARIKEYEGEQI